MMELNAKRPTNLNEEVYESSSVSDDSDDGMIEQPQLNEEKEKPETNNIVATNIPSLEEQGRIIKELKKNNTLVVGEKTYAISASWHSKWEMAVKSNYDSTSCFYPSNINNKDIYDSKHECLNYSKSESYDYILVNKAIWDKFNEWYPGGPEITIDVVMGPNKYPIAKVKMVLVVAKYKDQQHEIYISKNDKVSEVKQQFLELFNIKTKPPKPSDSKTLSSDSSSDNVIILDEDGNELNDNTDEKDKKKEEEEKKEIDPTEDVETEEDLPAFEDFRLLDNYNSSNVEMDDSRSISQCNIITNNPIILDYKEDGKWVNKTRETNRQTTQSTSSGYSGFSYGGYNSYYSRSYGPAAGPGKVGLMNLGNTCFFNSGTQCLLHTKPFVKALLADDWNRDINRTNPLGMHGRLAEAFQELLTRVWSGSESVLDPSRLKATIGQFNSTFSGWGQQDSHEYITFLLDGIHEDLNRCIEKPLTEGVNGDGTNDEETAARAWENHKKRNDSIVTDIFQGQYRSKLVCPKCHRVTVVFDPYTAVSLPISRPQVRALTVTFVPYDYAAAPEVISISVSSNPKPEEIDAALSEKLGRTVRTQIASTNYNGLYWGIHEEQYRSTAYYAFETPDPDKVYIACAVRGRKVNPAYPDFSNDDTISPVFVVGVPRDAVSAKGAILSDDDKKALEERAHTSIIEELEQKLACLWDGTPETATTDLMWQSIVANKKDPGAKFGAIIESPSTTYYNTAPEPTYLVFPRMSDRVTKNMAYILIGDEFRKAEKGFSFASLKRNESKMTPTSRGRDSSSVTLDECFRFFSTEETLDEQNEWFCPHCREHVCATKKMELWTAPQILIIHLKRFSGMGYYMHKDERLVQYPDEIDIANYVVGPHTASTRYRLYAVSEHMGSMMGGHYTAHAVVSELGKATGEWYSFNDSSAHEASASSAHNGSAYLLFYQRIDEECPIIEGSANGVAVDTDSDSDNLL